LIWGEKWGKENSVTGISAHGDSIYVLGVSEEPGKENLRVLKYNLSGGMQWNITLDGTGKGIFACNNSVLVSGGIGGESMLLDIDRNGNVLWNRSYGEGLIEDVAAGNSIYLLRSTSVNISVIKCDVNGNEIWARYYDDDIVGHSIAENKGNAFVAGSLYNDSSRDYDFMVLAYNKDGQLIGHAEYNGKYEDEAWDIALDGDNTAITGYSVIKKIVDGTTAMIVGRDYFTIEYEIKNSPPVANFSWSPDDAEVGKGVNFTDRSYDMDGSIVSYSWNFGDGTTSTEQNPTHEYKKDGFYRVNLTVTDNDGRSASVEKTIEIKEKERTPGFEFAALAAALCLIFAGRKIRLNF
ncbi:MAG TPA: PKD domain-containing protein, partial [Thermoplasmatales archaeon]|nr:PKD domain-containing protein [Thermoplasmatales archaeon]